MKLINSDCIAAMKEMPDNSVDSIVTDPPYELGFMGKSWDSSGIAFNVEVWQEALRVLKPGGHLLAFSGSRTYHRMAVAIEDAGFEIRDQIMWVYGSGFPKSHNIEKAINKIDGVEFSEKPASGVGFMNAEGAGGYNTTINQLEQVGDSTDRAKQWNGWGTALKPAHEPIVLARKPIIGTIANNVLTFGTGGLNIDGSRVGNEGGTKLADEDVEASQLTKTVTAYGNGLGGPFGKPVENLGRFPANFIHDGSDEVLALFPDTAGNHGGRVATSSFKFGAGDGSKISASNAKQDFGSAARFFYCAKSSKRDRNEGLDGFEAKQPVDGADKWTEQDRRRGEGVTRQPSANHHPTVKPTDLMRYLVRLITPPNGTVLDPFMGSGSTGKACAYEGFEFIGIDMTSEYVEIARARIAFAESEMEGKLL